MTTPDDTLAAEDHEIRVEYMRLDELHPDPRNPKNHSLPDIDASMDRFGYTEPVLLDERTGLLVAGHGRVESAQGRKARGEAPPRGVKIDPDGAWLLPVARGWSSVDDTDAGAYLVASNRLTEKGGWNDNALGALLSSLQGSDGLAGSGFSSPDVDRFLALLPDGSMADREPPDPAPIEDVATRVQPGELWALGDHRLYCGDATVPESYRALMGGTLADLIWTDPPYGVNYVGKTANALTIQNDDLDADQMRGLLGSSLGLSVAHARAGAAVWVAAGGDLVPFLDVLTGMGVLRQTLVWVKDRFVLGHSDYHYRHEVLFYGDVPEAPESELRHEFIAYGWVPGSAHTPTPDRTFDSVLEFPAPKRNAEHPTMKPVALIERAIRNHSAFGATVLDPFAGSGSTLMAAQASGRVARVIELAPRYADVILDRWERFTGSLAVKVEQ